MEDRTMSEGAIKALLDEFRCNNPEWDFECVKHQKYIAAALWINPDRKACHRIIVEEPIAALGIARTVRRYDRFLLHEEDAAIAAMEDIERRVGLQADCMLQWFDSGICYARFTQPR